MKIVLTGRRQMEIQDSDNSGVPADDQVRVKVLCCAICATDAKMWAHGHRDLTLPRVPGHEMVVADDQGNRYVVWPGKSCGTCRHCRAGRDNLCNDMEITGFHRDGGFATETLLPGISLIPIPGTMDTLTACFAEPAGCVKHALGKAAIKANSRVLIYGGGVMGLLTALMVQYVGGTPVVLERSRQKIRAAEMFLNDTGITCIDRTDQKGFDAVINACADPLAFGAGLERLEKGGRFAFFSGLTGSRKITTDQMNLIHYQELILSGAYGLKQQNMHDVLPFLADCEIPIKHLIEAVVPPEEAMTLMPAILSGNGLKYILDFTGDLITQKTPAPPDAGIRPDTGFLPDGGLCRQVICDIAPVDENLLNAACHKIDNKTKPPGSLGRLEALAIQMCLIQKTLEPAIRQKNLFVFAGDHGVTQEGVSAFPADVTGQMVLNFLNGGAAINVLCRHHDIAMKVVDMGIVPDLADHPDLIQKKIAHGTKNLAREAAMSTDEAIIALEHGMSVFLDAYAATPVDLLGVGEMGIGNTTPAAAIIAAITGISPAAAVGRGTGIDDKGLNQKIAVVERALALHQPDPCDGFAVLQTLGGFEIAGIAGAILAAASKNTAVMLDGVIATAAGLIAFIINPGIAGYLVAGHKSVEPAQAAALSFMDLEPLIDLGMRLGEGTGAALAMDMVEAACKVMTQMASFEDASVIGPEG
ncbi:MAG: nicotinate-nucleotide--dimethylbenzimidazole phosphoribosyltransferase [Thermodesulfobacteriota bacterium]|nr:nicotinate-nucleotide--dimethylbenzimidazole phosphoribosyltransferase [Thermodesulfobacteriota bacterium]